MAMFEGVEPLTLDTLNHATIAWLERDYHRRVHRELATTPLKRLLDSDDASRPCLDAAALRAAFRIPVKRTLRRSDPTACPRRNGADPTPKADPKPRGRRCVWGFWHLCLVLSR